MQDMGKRGVIDAELFRLFVDSGIAHEYSREHLTTAQIDVPAGARRSAASAGGERER